MEDRNEIIIYRITDRQGFFTVPNKWCEECDLLVTLIKQILKEEGLEQSTKLIVRPWLLWFWLPLFQFWSAHTPILIINKKLVSEGIVPKREDVVALLHT